MDTVKTKIKKQILKETNYEKIWSVNDFKKYPQMSVLKAFSDLYKENFIKRAKRGFYYRVNLEGFDDYRRHRLSDKDPA